MREAPELSLMIEGHTDAVGEAAYNLSLSKRRAAAVQAYIVDKFGVAPDRLEVVGKGMSEPLVADRADPSNRRVQFRRRT
jgi:outer membrane protein OmpA-like peptidoglycan-associated protein